MSKVLAVRAVKETAQLQKQQIPGCKICVDPTNTFLFHAVLEGPADTPYEGGHFDVQIFLPEAYPFQPPKVQFITKIYHPNIDLHGRVCLNVLKNEWAAVMNIRTVVLSLIALLSSPNADDGLDPTIAAHFRNNQEEAEAKAREWVKLYASK